MTTEQLRELIKQALPELLATDPEIRELVLRLSRTEFADKMQTEDRFTQLLNELRRDREEGTRRWEEQNREQKAKWEEQNAKWEEENRRWDEQNREQKAKWEEQNRRWDEQNREQKAKWEEQNRRWDEQNEKWQEYQRKWDEQQRQMNRFHDEFDRVHEEIMAVAARQDRTIGALGARWGVSTEEAFRNALAAILEKSFGVEVLNVTEYDDEGSVFGRPDQVELDVIVRNGTLILCEIKSSVDKAAMYIFERKVRFYESRHGRKADRMLVISPMIEAKARTVGEALGIEMYSDSADVEPG